MNLPWKQKATVGRELDPKLAIVTGEGSQIAVRRPEPASTPIPVWEVLPSVDRQGRPDYYGIPLLKEPVWIWSVPVYFWAGGVAGGSAVLGAALHGKRKMRKLASACRWLSFLGTTVGPALLTWDLGKKTRFLNMLRVFRPTSPMSIGSWALAGSGMLSTIALLQGDRPSARPTNMALAGGGIVLSGYTGVLLGNTANPLWWQTRRTLPILFTASAMASTAAVLEMLPLKKREERVVQVFGTIGKVGEAAGMMAMEKIAGRVPEVANPFREGKCGFLWQSARGLVAAGIILNLLPGKSPFKRRLGGALTTVGALCLRYALLESGKCSARDPQAVFEAQRAHQDAVPMQQNGGELQGEYPQFI
ncbi:polysulfide reductase NrfD [Geomonas sp. RF6]|uniref:NrfD/PsrC family molybdoenzyme membrane anchor subunit n=1 Tax=Geomonas sp. RF6 TaxID=2897342 RepID=UPI001E5B03C9|nr:NrfD/PsrC family molybdoenzyme membrane anchor subunit [Geomonas sp. RF6]UFS70378.1 polysulfide reductase NrfD [Geomonas sp. RF6]